MQTDSRVCDCPLGLHTYRLSTAGIAWGSHQEEVVGEAGEMVGEVGVRGKCLEEEVDGVG